LHYRDSKFKICHHLGLGAQKVENHWFKVCDLYFKGFHYFLEDEADARPVIDSLLSKNADINARDHEDRTPLLDASECNNSSIVQHLVSMLLQLNQKDRPLKLLNITHPLTFWIHLQ
jgi:ankyrin repeat protein